MKRIHSFLSTTFLTALLFCSVNDLKAQMFWNQAGKFTGVDSSHIAVADNATLDITGSFTVECWMNPVNSVSPFSQVILQKRTSATVNTGYAMILINGRIFFNTGNLWGITGRTVIPNNTWTHASGRYNSTSNTFSLFINGVLDTSAVVAAPPSVNNDSILIGVGRGLGSSYSGKLDDIRVWNRALSGSEISKYYRTSLGLNSGIYNGLILSITFQKQESTGTVFSADDFSGTGNHGYIRNVLAADLSGKLYETVSFNESAELDGTNDYLSAPNNTAIQPVTEITMEAWIYPRSNSNSIIIHKGTDDGVVTNFMLAIQNKKIIAGIKQNYSFTTADTISINKWSHIAFTYESVSGKYIFYLNGKISSEGINSIGLIASSSDSLYIGGTTAMGDFNGFIDEVRITEKVKSHSEIVQNLFRSVDKSNESLFDDVSYNLDGSCRSNTGQGTPLNFRNNAGFSHPATTADQPVSPLIRKDSQYFTNSFYMSTPDLRIPITGDAGLTEDEIEVFENEPITDAEVFVALNHQKTANLKIVLNAPNGDYTFLFDEAITTGTDNNIVTIFSDNADTAFSNKYPSFSPSLKSIWSLNNTLTGNTKGLWKLTIFDNTGTDTGRIYAWGIRFNNKTSKSNILETRVFIQGFYNPATNNTIRDTVTFNLRDVSAPYNIIESKKTYLPANNFSYLRFFNAEVLKEYYLEAVHRNSISVWSSSTVKFSPLTAQLSYLFTGSISSAYGDNMIMIDSTPVRYGLFSGDINRDEAIDLTDVLHIYNDAVAFSTGYIITDITGDNIADLTDLLFAYNNSAGFVAVIKP